MSPIISLIVQNKEFASLPGSQSRIASRIKFFIFGLFQSGRLLSLCLVTLTFLKSTRKTYKSYFSECPSISVCLMSPGNEILVMDIWQKYNRSDVTFHIRWHLQLVCPIKGGVNFEHLVKTACLVSSQDFTCQLHYRHLTQKSQNTSGMSPLTQFLLSVFFVTFAEILFGGSSLLPTCLIIYLLLTILFLLLFLSYNVLQEKYLNRFFFRQCSI